MDAQIEQLAKSCHACQRIQSKPARVPTHPWLPARDRWEGIHKDFAGPFMDRMYLVVVGAYSKWPEKIIMDSTTTEKTIEELRKLFSTWDLPEIIVSDNAPQLKSQVFRKICGIKWGYSKFSCPRHPLQMVKPKDSSSP